MFIVALFITAKQLEWLQKIQSYPRIKYYGGCSKIYHFWVPGWLCRWSTWLLISGCEFEPPP